MENKDTFYKHTASVNEATKAGYSRALHFLIANDWEFHLVNGSHSGFGIKVTLPAKLRDYWDLDFDEYTETIGADDSWKLAAITLAYPEAVDLAFHKLDEIYQEKQREAESFKADFIDIHAVEMKKTW